MLFHLDFLPGQGIYDLHRDVLLFFENAINEDAFSEALISGKS